MIAKEMMFKYSDCWESGVGDDEFVLRVPGGVRSKIELLETLASAGNFPDYFGGNWDALQDCLRDLSWISNKGVAIAHSDLPLLNDPSECRIYLEILSEVVVDWMDGVQPGSVEPSPEWNYVEHEFTVIFPVSARDAVKRAFTDA